MNDWYTDMIDLHIHILPGLDDGAADLSEALEMARLAAENGTSALAATVHSYARRGFYELLPDDIKETADQLSRALADTACPLRIYTGMEVLLEASMLPLLQEGRLLTLGDTRWLLTEFYGGESASEMTSLLRAVVNMGYTPLIAHAERYKALQKHPELGVQLNDMGCAIQVNARSLTGEADRKYVKTARRLCEKGCVQAVATDAHNTTTRPPLLRGAWEWLAEHYSPLLADRLTHDNPAALLSGAMPAELIGRV